MAQADETILRYWQETYSARTIEAYKQRKRAEKAEKLLREIRDGKHSLPGTLTQIKRYFDDLGADRADRQT